MLEHVHVGIDAHPDYKGFSVVKSLYSPPFGLCGDHDNKSIVPHHDVAYPYTPVSLEDLGQSVFFNVHHPLRLWVGCSP